MDSQEARISIPGLIMQLLWIAALVLLLGKSQYALTRAKTELEIVEPVWKTGEATSGRATARQSGGCQLTSPGGTSDK